MASDNAKTQIHLVLSNVEGRTIVMQPSQQHPR